MVLNGIFFEVDKGEFVGIMGLLGSGKIMLLNILSGIDRVVIGSVKINKKDIVKMDKNEIVLFRRYEIGFIF